MQDKTLLLGLGAAASLLLTGCEPSREELIVQHRSTIDRFCTDCHNDIEREAELTLESLSLDAVAEHPEAWEQVVRKLRAGMMPPADRPRPEEDTYARLTSFIESELDAGFEPVLPPPGIHRLNRAEYGNAVRDLLALEVDPTQFLPADDSSRGFDNQAGTLSLSPALLEAYLRAADNISRLAVGAVDTPSQATYRVAEDTTQDYHVEGLPFGTRGGTLIEHYFPADGEYDIKIYSVNLGNMGNFRPFGEVDGEQLEVLIDGERVALFEWDEEFSGFGGGQLKTLDVRVPVEAGPHEVGVTFLASNHAPLLDLNDKFERSTIETGGLPGFTFYPHIGSVRIDGPFNAQRPEETPSRRKIFVCDPEAAVTEEACARQIVANLARLAYRGTQTEQDVETLMEFFREGRELGGGFDSGVQMAVQRVLTDPKFIYRVETEPLQLAEGELYEIDDLELAARLSFFLWSSIPDDELLTQAEEGRLGEPEVLRAQVQRMLDDPRSRAFTENFAGQWLALRGLDVHQPVVEEFPDFDDNLRQAFRRETELFFDSIVRENRSILDLLDADYTFVNERLAKHYDIPGIKGSRFRRVELDGDLAMRRGLLGKGSLLTVASRPSRTSPVIRGNWILTNVIGVPPPPPPPDVPALEPETADAAGNTRTPTIREQYEGHRNNPACMGCHMLMDPFGFAMENFDAVGRWRLQDSSGNPIDASDVMYDGTPVEGTDDLRAFLMKYDEQFVRNFTEKLMTYAVGRGLEYYDMPIVRSVVAEAAEDDYRFGSLVNAVVSSDLFRMNMKVGDGGAQLSQRVAARAEGGEPADSASPAGGN